MTSLSPYTRHPSTYEMEALIREVKYRPAIWNKNFDGYMDRRLKGRMWEEICETLVPKWKNLKALQKHQISCDVQKKWRNVKDAFKKERHIERKIAAGELVRKKKRYVHYEALSFLADAELCRKDTALLNDTDEESDNGSIEHDKLTYSRKRIHNENSNEIETMVKVKLEHFNSDEIGDSDVNNDSLLETHMECSELSDEVGTVPRKRLKKGAACTDPHFVEVPNENWANDDNSEPEPRKQCDSHQSQRSFKYYDEDVSFTEMIVPILRKMNDDQKHYAKVEIMNILHKIKRYRLAMSSATQTEP